MRQWLYGKETKPYNLDLLAQLKEYEASNRQKWEEEISNTKSIVHVWTLSKLVSTYFYTRQRKQPTFIKMKTHRI